MVLGFVLILVESNVLCFLSLDVVLSCGVVCVGGGGGLILVLFVLLSTHSLNTCSWEESDLTACGSSTSLSGQQFRYSGGVCP